MLADNLLFQEKQKEKMNTHMLTDYLYYLYVDNPFWPWSCGIIVGIKFAGSSCDPRQAYLQFQNSV